MKRTRNHLNCSIFDELFTRSPRAASNRLTAILAKNPRSQVVCDTIPITVRRNYEQADNKRPRKTPKKSHRNYTQFTSSARILYAPRNFIGLFYESTIKLISALDELPLSKPCTLSTSLCSHPPPLSNLKILAILFFFPGTLPETMERYQFQRFVDFSALPSKTFQHAVRIFPVAPTPRIRFSSFFFREVDETNKIQKNPNAERKSATPCRRHIRTDGPIFVAI